MLIAVFITEMVILHKYVYLFILFIYHVNRIKGPVNFHVNRIKEPVNIM